MANRVKIYKTGTDYQNSKGKLVAGQRWIVRDLDTNVLIFDYETFPSLKRAMYYCEQMWGEGNFEAFEPIT